MLETGEGLFQIILTISRTTNHHYWPFCGIVWEILLILAHFSPFLNFNQCLLAKNIFLLLNIVPHALKWILHQETMGYFTPGGCEDS